MGFWKPYKLRSDLWRAGFLIWCNNWGWWINIFLSMGRSNGCINLFYSSFFKGELIWYKNVKGSTLLRPGRFSPYGPWLPHWKCMRTDALLQPLLTTTYHFTLYFSLFSLVYLRLKYVFLLDLICFWKITEIFNLFVSFFTDVAFFLFWYIAW